MDATVLMDETLFSQIHDRLNLGANSLLLGILDLVVRIEDLHKRSDFDVKFFGHAHGFTSIELGELHIATGSGQFSRC